MDDLSRWAVVMGGAHSAFRDLYAIEAVTGPWPGLVVACNDIGVLLPRLDAWCSLHPDKLVTRCHDADDRRPWVEQRRMRGLPDAPTWSHGERAKHPTDAELRGWSNGSSGLLAVGVAFAIGAEYVVLCGVRMDRQRNHFRDEKGWQQFQRYRNGWNKKREQMQGRVFSVSGWTRDLLGPPPFMLAEREAA